MEEIKNELIASTPAVPQKKSNTHKKPTPQTKANFDQAIIDDLPEALSPEELRRKNQAEIRARLRREWEVESKMVTGVFRDLEVGPGGNIRFSARKYPWDQVQDWHFVDGQTYTIPLWLARHLNEDCKYPVYRHNVDPNAKEGEKVKQFVGQYNHRFAFISNDFVNLHKPEITPLIIPGR